MADLAFMAELDASKFNRALDQMDARTRQSGLAFERFEKFMGVAFGSAALFKGAKLGADSLDEWAKRSDQAKGSMDAIGGAWSQIKADIGSDLIGLVDGTDSWVRSLGDARNAFTDFSADILKGETGLNKSARAGEFGTLGMLFDRGWREVSEFVGFSGGGSSSEVRAQQQKDAALQREFAKSQKLTADANRTRESLSIDLAELADNPVERERIRHRQRSREIRQGGQDAGVRDELQQLENQRHSASLRNIAERKAKEHDARRDAVDFEIARGRLDIDGINAKGIEVELDRVRLDYTSRIARLNKDDLLTQLEKNDAIAAMESNRDLEIAARQARFARDEASQQKYTVLELAGVADNATRRQVIGAGSASADPMKAASERTATAAEKTAAGVETGNKLSEATLRSIDDFVRGAGVARYGR